MNKAVKLLSFFCLTFLFATSCEKETLLEVSQSSLTFVEGGGTQTISFSTNKEWSASVSGGTGWCTISPTNGKSDIKAITVTTVANTTYDDRTATITINVEELSRVVTITQPKNRAIILTKDSFEIGAAGGNISLELNSNIEFDVTIPTENQSWITNTTTKGLTTSTLTFAILPNGTYDSRVGKIIIKDKTTALSDTVTISQVQKDAIILTQKTFNIADTLITLEVELKSNVSYLVTIPSTAQLWIKQLQTKALKTESLKFEITRNTSLQPRSAEIIVLKALTTLADTLVINQAKAPDVPILTTDSAFNIGSTTANIGGNVISDGGADIIERGICWSIKSNPTIVDHKKAVGKGAGKFETDLGDLPPDSKLYVRTYATNRTGTGYGNIVSFITYINALPLIRTNTISEVTTNSAISGGYIYYYQIQPWWITGVCYSKNVNPTLKDSVLKTDSPRYTFTLKITGLNKGTKYYIRAFVKGPSSYPDNGTSYGEQFEFTTLQTEPSVSLISEKRIGLYSLEVNCTVTDDGGDKDTKRGVCWSKNPLPTINDSKTENGVGAGDYTAQITNLEKSTEYYVRAYATNKIGTKYSFPISIKTYEDIINDAEGNSYITTKIGQQIWMAENLKASKYQNGELIGTTNPSSLIISGETKPKYQWAYGGDESNVEIYGRLYTWHVVTDSRGICPSGWHVPSYNEWDQLKKFVISTYGLDGYGSIGNHLKEVGSDHWAQNSATGNNITNFTALPGGWRDSNESFTGLKSLACWWLSDENNSYFINLSVGLGTNIGQKFIGNSVRCVKD